VSKICTYERLDKANRHANEAPAVGWGGREAKGGGGGWEEVKIKEREEKANGAGSVPV